MKTRALAINIGRAWPCLPAGCWWHFPNTARRHKAWVIKLWPGIQVSIMWSVDEVIVVPKPRLDMDFGA